MKILFGLSLFPVLLVLVVTESGTALSVVLFTLIAFDLCVATFRYHAIASNVAVLLQYSSAIDEALHGEDYGIVRELLLAKALYGARGL